MSFALRHAAAHGLRRVIYAIPFTSIIEQNAAKFREALGAFAEHLIEHHSNRDPDAASQAEQLASENWDAEIVVTTNVQLLESLFASKTSQCRKLHRIANSVIVLDEAQTLPVDLLEPTLRALEALVTDYGCSIVLCTATQPAITRREGFEIGLPIPAEREIAGTSAEVQNLFGALRRTRVQMGGALADDELVTRLIDQQQVLCIVNTKSHCADLYDGLAARLRDREGVFHLSTFMCPAHRTETLNTIRARLHASLPCRVISTSLIEAGVDIDFPVVFRARAGLDSILQAAGRCNREGKRDLGHVMVFDTDQQNPQLAQAQFAVADVLLTHGDRLDSPEAIEAYFRNWLFRESGHAKTRSSWDRKRIMDCFDVGSAGWEFQFRRAAADYRLIPQEQIRVVVPFDDTARQLISALNAMPKAPGRAFHRRLQKYAVSLSEWNLHRLDREGRLEPQNHSGIRVLREGTDAYDPLRGLRLGGPDDPDRLTV
jgi:CRISPR-associated endonuclease/helicase Cas3